MLLIVLLGTAGGVVATRFLPPIYTAKATIWIEEGGGKTARSGLGSYLPSRLGPNCSRPTWCSIPSSTGSAST
jgi:uncharacterized protein involved in exopolysaccharide biosynthesis